MTQDAPLESAPPERVPLQSGGRLEHIPRAARRALLVAAGGYAVVGLFGVAYAVVNGAWSGLSNGSAVAVAALVAAPFAIALLWPRLAGLKAFGFELSLSQATTELDAELGAVIMSQQYFSDPKRIVEGMAAAIGSGAEAVEVNLRDGAYWWCSRLYLLAALAGDYTSIRTLVFVEAGARRAFVGTAPPAQVRSALGAALPALERIYADVKPAQPDLEPVQRVAAIATAWSGRFGGPKDELPTEPEIPRVSADSLASWLAIVGKTLERASVEWTGVSDPHVVRAIALDYDSLHVALLRRGRLDRLVNRLELGKRIAQRALE